MDASLAAHLIEVINWHRTWLKAVDFGEQQMTVSASGRGISKSLSRVFRLEVRIPLYGYRRGFILNVTEQRLDAAIAELSKTQLGFGERFSSLSLTFKDVNRIFSVASWDAIELGLED